MPVETQPVRWACPKCDADANKHGRGHGDVCDGDAGDGDECQGFLCECEVNRAGHGESMADRCKEANCFHCGWGGVFPPTPKGIPPWAKKALEAGWIAPKGWKP